MWVVVVESIQAHLRPVALVHSIVVDCPVRVTPLRQVRHLNELLVRVRMHVFQLLQKSVHLPPT